MKSPTWLCLLAFLVSGTARAETSLVAITFAAEKASNLLTATQSQEKVAESAVAVAKGDYLPHLEADFADTGGFPGSSSSMGIGGLVGSPYRSGPGAGLIATTTLWDFGRTSASVHAADHLWEAQKSQTQLAQIDVDSLAARLFFDCARYESQLVAWTQMYTETRIVSGEVERFVKTGQRSIVERYLSQAQLAEALTNQTDFAEKLRLAERKLQVLTRMPLELLQCPSLVVAEKQIQPSPAAVENPILTRANHTAEAAQDQVDATRADFLPKLKAFAGVGALENSRLVSKQDYALGVGVTFPLFDGFKTLNGLEGARAYAFEKEKLINAAQDQIDLTNAQFEQVIESSMTRLSHLHDEQTLADEGFKVAKSRYFSMQGNLIDLREALRNLMRVRSETIDTQAQYDLAVVEQNLFNGKIAKK